MMKLLFISGQEILVVFALALLFFGARSIPEIARVLGKGVREFRRATNEIQKEFDDSTSDLKNNINEVNKTICSNARKIKENIDTTKK
jgi:sec-independent protein translocase protein TatA